MWKEKECLSAKPSSSSSSDSPAYWRCAGGSAILTPAMKHTAETLQQVDRVFVRWRGRRLVYFAGCDYFRLASHPRVLAAVRRGLKEFGLNVAASRKTTGNHALYEELEQAVARFCQAERAVLVDNGYMTNLAVAQAFRGEFTHVLMDARSHTSVRSMAKMSGG